MDINDFLTAVKCRVTAGGNYGWNCWGECFQLDCCLSNNVGESSVVFGLATGTVYEVTAFDYINNRAYRWQHPDHRAAYVNECTARGVDPVESTDEMSFLDEDEVSSILDKVAAVVDGEPYDSRVSVILELEDDLVLLAMKQAHKQDITFNQYIEKVIKSMVSWKEIETTQES